MDLALLRPSFSARSIGSGATTGLLRLRVTTGVNVSAFVSSYKRVATRAM